MSVQQIDKAPTTIYRAAVGFEADLEAEFAHRSLRATAIAPGWWQVAGPAQALIWVDDIWFAAEELRIDSINDAARQLRERQGWWTHHPLQTSGQTRRGELIAGRLPQLRWPELRFPLSRPLKPTGGFMLLEQDRLFCASHRQRPFPDAVPAFVEDHAGPPSRAYRKLWEALLLLGDWPQADERCWDLGAAPGAWTWVLAGLGARVLAIDKAPIDPRLANAPLVEARQTSAFAMDPEQDPVDWICSDVICYPARLLKTVTRWLEQGACERFIITVKCQGPSDFDSLFAFQALPHSQLVHLGHNKHEVTWIRHPDLPDTGGALSWPWLKGLR